MKNEINLIDCTLREGNQSPGMQFNVANSVAFVNLLPVDGIAMVEVGHASASVEEFKRTKAVVDTKKFPVLTHARAMKEDIEISFQTGAQWVGIFAGVNTISQQYRLRKTKTEILERVQQSIAYAKDRKMMVRYTPEDSSRTPMQELLETYKLAIEAGADRICFADTLGLLTHHETAARINFIRKAFPLVQLETHFHDDRGFAMANSLTAVAAGSDWLSCSVNGLGERAGITDTCLLLANLYHMQQVPEELMQALLPMSKYVSEISQSPVDDRRPVTGRNVFVHTAKLHRDAMLLNAGTYNWINPDIFKS